MASEIQITPVPKNKCDSIVDYVNYFERVRQANGWDDTAAARVFPGLLEIGSSVLEDLDSATLLSFKAIKEALIPKTECFREVEVQTFFGLSKKDDESVEVFYKRCKSAVALCYPKFAKANREALIRDRFVHGLPTSLKTSVFNQKNEKLDDAVQAAMLVETVKRTFEKQPETALVKYKTGVKVEYPKDKMASVQCFRCQQFGHFARVCPNRSKWENTTHSSRRGDVACLDKCSDRPMVDSVINGVRVTMLIDTGASVSMLPSDKFMADTEVNGQNIRTATNSPIRIDGTLMSQVQIGKWKAEHCFYVGDVQMPVLGIDFLKHHGVQLDTRSGRLKLAGLEVASMNDEHEGEFSRIATITKKKPDAVCMISATDLTPELGSGINWSLNQTDLLETLRHKFPTVFNGIGHTNVINHKIKTGSIAPINMPSHRLPIHLLGRAKTSILRMAKEGIIRKSNSAWSNPVVIVPKKDGDVRVAIDFRELNKNCLMDAYPMPRIDECLERLQGSNVYSLLDCNSGYYQIDVNENDRVKTAFRFGGELWEFCRMPFGLAAAPATFCRLMKTLFNGEQNVVTYLDDICIFSRNEEEHKSHLERALSILQKAGLTLNVQKCKLFKNSIEFLGYNIRGEEIRPSEKKWEALTRYPKPNNSKEVKSFIGLAGYYRNLIPNFSIITAPLHALTGKKLFLWDKRHQDAFDSLKAALRQNVVRVLPDADRNFIVRTDASLEGVGCLLLQKDETGERRIVECASKKFTTTQKRYSVIEQEAYAIIFALDKWEHFLLGKRFTLETDHRPLQWLQSKRNCFGKLGRWALRLVTFQFDIKHIPGNTNIDADALSRAALCSVEVGRYKEHFEEWVKMQKEDIQLREAQNKEPERYKEVDGLVYRTQDDKLRLYVPAQKRKDIWTELHDEMGHRGPLKVLEVARERFYWPKMRNDFKNWAKKCQSCETKKDFTPTPQEAPMVTVDYSHLSPMEKIAIDVVGPFPEATDGSRYLLVLVDCFTKWAIAKSVKTIHAEQIIKWLSDDVFSMFAIPREIILDCGSNMESSELKDFCARLGVHLRYTTIYHHQSNPVERLNRTLINMLRMYIEDNQKDWSVHIPKVLFSYRVSKHDSIQLSPYEALFGVQPRLPIDLKYSTQLDFPRGIKEVVEKLSNAHQMVRVALQKSSSKGKQEYDNRHKVKEPEFKVNDLVYMKRHQYSKGLARKLSTQWIGPYRLIRRLSEVNWLVEGEGGQSRPIHANLLKACHLPPEEASLGTIRKRGRPKKK